MGQNHPPKHESLRRPIEKQWQPVSSLQNYIILKHILNSKQAQLYDYILDNRYDPKEEDTVFLNRYKTQQPIVKVWQYELKQSGGGLGQNNCFRVVTERLVRRLGECPQLAFDEALYVLRAALEGYEYLYHRLGSFQITNGMLGFNQEGYLKVWHNENMGMNYPSSTKHTLCSTRVDHTYEFDKSFISTEQISMVRNIINLVEDKCQEGQFSQEFREQIRSNVGFSEAREIVHQEIQTKARLRLQKIDLIGNVVKRKVSEKQGVNAGNWGLGNQQFNRVSPAIGGNIANVNSNTNQNMIQLNRHNFETTKGTLEYLPHPSPRYHANKQSFY